MWTNKYLPTIGDWYLVKIEGKKQILKWNNHNHFFADFTGKTYKFDQIDCWLDDSKVSKNINSINKNIIFFDSFWNKDKTIWKQPPVKIKHGDLVDIEYNNQIVLGRYIGKGLGIAEFYNYATGIVHHIGKVISRGLNKNPRLISDEDLFKYIED